MAYSKDLFDLSGDLNFNEGADEFEENDPATHAGGDIDKDATSAKETSIPVPNTTTLDEDTYNAALKALKASFKEAGEVIDMLTGTYDNNKMFESYCEAVVTEMAQDLHDVPFTEQTFDRKWLANKLATPHLSGKSRDAAGNLKGHQEGESYKTGAPGYDYETLRSPMSSIRRGAGRVVRGKLGQKLFGKSDEKKFKEEQSNLDKIWDEVAADPVDSKLTVFEFIDKYADPKVKKDMMKIRLANDKEELKRKNAKTESAENQLLIEMESAIDDQIMDIFESGPIFEAVNRDDKKALKKIVASLRPKIAKMAKKSDINFYKPALAARFFFDPNGFWTQVWSTRLYQVIGIMNIEQGAIKDICDKLTELYKDELGEYKILWANAPSNLIDVFRLHFNWKNTKKTYFILVDKQIDKEVKDAIKEMNDRAAADANDQSKEVTTEAALEIVETAMAYLTEAGEVNVMNVVSKADKEPVKKIVDEVRPRIQKLMDNADVTFYKPNLVARALAVGGAAAWKQIWTARLWQVLGIICMESANIAGVCAKLNEIYEDKLNGYKIIHEDVPPALLDFFREKFNYKNNLRTYMLLIDTDVVGKIGNAMDTLGDEPDEDDKKKGKKDKKDKNANELSAIANPKK